MLEEGSVAGEAVVSAAAVVVAEVKALIKARIVSS
jgi:hypothetical protein